MPTMVSTPSAHKQKTTLADGSSGVVGHGAGTIRVRKAESA